MSTGNSPSSSSTCTKRLECAPLRLRSKSCSAHSRETSDRSTTRQRSSRRSRKLRTFRRSSSMSFAELQAAHCEPTRVTSWCDADLEGTISSLKFLRHTSFRRGFRIRALTLRSFSTLFSPTFPSDIARRSAHNDLLLLLPMLSTEVVLSYVPQRTGKYRISSAMQAAEW